MDPFGRKWRGNLSTVNDNNHPRRPQPEVAYYIPSYDSRLTFIAQLIFRSFYYILIGTDNVHRFITVQTPMKFRISILLFAICFIFASFSPAGTKKKLRVVFQDVKQLQAKIDSILDAKELSSSFIGIKIAPVDDETILYARNSTKLFHPASNTKLITTAAALAKLPHHVYRTKLSSGSNIKNGVLSGSIYIRGTGDPLLNSADLDSLAGMVQKKGIQTITGNIVGDISYFDTVAWGRGWMWDDEPSSDEPFVTPLSVDSNSIYFKIEPAASLASMASFTTEPFTDLFNIANTCITQKDTANNPVIVTRRRGTNNIVISGSIYPGTATEEFTYSVWKPELVLLHILKDKLQARGITVKGTCTFDSIRGRNLIGEIDHPIDSVIIRVNKDSYNLGAESLVKTLAAEIAGTPGTWENGVDIIKDYLNQLGIDTTNMILMDGSGVSFYNLFTPSDMVRLLKAQYRSNNNFQRFYESLPVAGVDGTLKNRMKGTPAAGNVRAKTGTLTGSSALSGYITTADKKLLAFSIMNNHFPGEGKVLREMQNKILELLAGYGKGK
jgi:D-alanyl-D-alanine carboxypeptidase/D-alanyl-D-alanine-endopeptidase (penicillin-binding protein 4)